MPRPKTIATTARPTLAAILDRLYGVHRTAAWMLAFCPLHFSLGPALLLRESPHRGVELYCIEGCAPEAILRAIGFVAAAPQKGAL
ncbi:MAG: hypothetical protein FJ206_00015 [Gemmatimonadetes bacterium]|nr:hypothetical protein [Gemmatimonadota bacterium]